MSVFYDLCQDGAGGVLVLEDPAMDRLSESVRTATILSPARADPVSPSSRSLGRSKPSRRSSHGSFTISHGPIETLTRDAEALAEVGAGPSFSDEIVDDDMADIDNRQSDLDIIMDDDDHPLSPRERADIRSLAKFFDSVHLQDGGVSTSRSSAVRFLLWGISPYMKMISASLWRLAETQVEGYHQFVAAARILAGMEEDEEDEEDPSRSKSFHIDACESQCTLQEI